MKRIAIIVLTFMFLYGGVAHAVIDCFKHFDAGKNAGHHQVQLENLEHDHLGEEGHQGSQIHCPELRFDLGLARLSSDSNSRAQKCPDRFSKDLNPSSQQPFSQNTKGSIERFPPVSSLLGIPPYLYLSILQI